MKPMQFLSTIGIIVILVDIYFYQAFRIKFFDSPLTKWVYWVGSIVMLGLFVYTMMMYQVKDSPKYLTPLRGLVFAVFVGKLIGLVPLIIDDVGRLVRLLSNWIGYPIVKEDADGGISRLDFLQKSALALGGLFFATLTWGVVSGRFRFTKMKKKVKIKNWPDQLSNLKVIQISDIHLGSFTSTEPIEEVVRLINEEKPDFVFFTGDLVNSFAWEAEPFVEALLKLKAKHGVYSILGNHDYADYAGLDRRKSEDNEVWLKNHEEMLDMHKRMGFNLLLNEHKEFNIDGAKFNLVGIENWGAGGFSKYGDLEKAVEGMNQDLPTILLSHDPSHWEEQVQKDAQFIDLHLAGHTHGMQFGIELGGFKWSPVQWRYKQWADLYAAENGQQIYVNRGLGHVGYPGRVGIMPEISILSFEA